MRGTTVSSGCGSLTTQASCQASSGCGWANGACGGNISSQCAYGQWWDSATQSCKSSGVQTVGSCDYSTQYWKASTSQCQPRTNCSDSANSEYNSSECQGVRTTSSGTCPSGYHYHSESGGFCMNSQENYSGTCYNSAGTSTITCPQSTYPGSSCPSGQYWSGSACVTTSTTCPTGQYWSGSACVSSEGSGCSSYTSQANCVSASQTCNWNTSGSNGWCQQATTASSCGNYICESGEMTSCSSDCATYTTCPTGQYWSGSACVSSSTTGQCPSGQYWYTPPSGGTGYCMSTSSTDCTSGQYWNGSACVTTSTTDTTCPSGQYWNGSSCQSSSTPTPTPEPTPTPAPSDPATMCTQAGGTWDGSTCQMAMVLCGQSGGTWTGAACNLAENISDQKSYYSYFQKQSSSFLAQVISAFGSLFK